MGVPVIEIVRSTEGIEPGDTAVFYIEKLAAGIDPADAIAGDDIPDTALNIFRTVWGGYCLMCKAAKEGDCEQAIIDVQENQVRVIAQGCSGIFESHAAECQDNTDSR